MPNTAVRNRGTLSRTHWIGEAEGLLVGEGVEAVRVDVLAKSLGVTRGSFYWHFKDRGELLASLLDAWRDAATEQIIDRFERRTTDPRALVKELLSLPFRGKGAERAARIELAIRTWALRDDAARRALDEVDARRISYIAQVFSSLGFSVREARSRAFVLYAYEVAESLLRRQGTAEQKRERCALVERLLLAA